MENQALVVKLYPNSMTSKIICDNLQSIDICEDIFAQAEKFPYGEILNACINFSLQKYETLINDILNDLQNNNTNIPSAEIINKIEGYSVNANAFEKHFKDIIRNEYIELITDISSNYESLRTTKFNSMIKLLTFPTGKDMLNILSYFERTPFISLSKTDKNHIANIIKKEKCFSNNYRNGNIFVYNLAQITMYYVNKMKEDNIYIHQCAACGGWFAISEIKKSLLCGGTFCRHTPKLSPNERYKEKLKLLPYRDAFDKEYNYWYLKKHRQTLTNSKFNKWYSEAKQKLELVESGKMDEEAFLTWLVDCRKYYKSSRLEVNIEKSVDSLGNSLAFNEEYSFWRRCLEDKVISKEQFEKWREEAREKMKQVEFDKITQESFLSWIKMSHDDLVKKGENKNAKKGT